MPKSASELRREFYSSISDTKVAQPLEAVFEAAAAEWRRVTGADSCWVWIHNVYTDQWELVCRSGVDSRDPVMEEVMNKNDGSVAGFAAQLDRGVFIPNLAWSDHLDGREYRVACRKWLESLNVTCFDAFPIRVHFANTTPLPPLQQDITVVFCCHYTARKNRVHHEPHSSDAMRRVTALVVANHIQSRHFQLVMKLNDLSRRYLTRITRTPAQDRTDYLRYLSKVITAELSVRGVSVFYRVPFEDAAVCLFSTGLCDKNGRPIAPDAFSDVKYELGDGRTGACLKDGRPRFISVNDVDNENARYIELDKHGNMTNGPALLCPIPRSSFRDPRQDGPHADGVVRCTEHPARFRQDSHRNFNPIEAYTLQFICLQVSPVMDMLSARIAREQQVSIIKHDLEAPLFMIRDTAEQIARETEQKLPLAEYCIPDLNMASVLGLNLVSFLEVAPAEITRCDPRWTFLEGEIVARNKSMLKYYARKVGDMTISFESFHFVPQLWIDRDLVERVFLNLMINAIKYGAPGSQIRVIPRATNGWYHVDVENMGIGVSERDEKHIFKPYYRGARAKKRKLGVGLGLYIARVAMEKNGGKLELRQRENPTVFTMSFPARIARPGH